MRLLGAFTSVALLFVDSAHAQDTAVTPPPVDVPAQEPVTAQVTSETMAPTPVEAAQAFETAPVEAAPAEAAPAEETVELSAAELEQLGLGSDAGGSTLDTSLKFWGFADSTIGALMVKKNSPWRGILNRYPSFYVGNFNLYLSKNITERIRTMAEVRFTYQPNGGVANLQTGERTSTELLDYSTNTPVRWGGVIPQRIYVEITLHELAVLRIGQFLTPYGIWNIDHGSPAIIPVLRPPIITQIPFPENQTGLELLGRWRVNAEHVLGYHLTLSNGLGPVSEYRDLDKNKAVGGRAYWQFEKLGTFQLGGSILYGKDTSSSEIPGIVNGKFTFTEKVSNQSDVLSLGGDIRWTVDRLIVQGEVVAEQRRYTDGGRPGAVNPLVGRWAAPQDDLKWGWYALSGYRFDWLGVMPYVMVSELQVRDPRTLSTVKEIGVTGGLNIRPVDAFVFKIEYGGAKFLKSFISKETLHQIQTQVAWAF